VSGAQQLFVAAVLPTCCITEGASINLPSERPMISCVSLIVRQSDG
jgi:hypothetical protein